MSDDRYERSADMRLLELRRVSLGIPQRVIGSTSYTDPDALTDSTNEPVEAYVQSGTILVATIDARPRAALIPGAVVTVSMTVSNDGDVAARGVRVSLPLPVDTTYRPGTLSIDGSAAAEALAGELFGVGAELDDIEPGVRRTVTVNLLVEAGIGDIILSPHLSALSAAILGLRAMRLKRNAPSSRGVVLERPFYESDQLEHELDPLPAPAPKPFISIVQPREFPSQLQAKPPAEPNAIPAPIVPALTASVVIPSVAPALAPLVPSPQIEPVQANVGQPVAQAVAPPVKKPVEAARTKPVAAAVTVDKPNPKTATKPVAPGAEKPAEPTKAKPAARTATKPTAKTVTYAAPKRTSETKTKPKPPAKVKPNAESASTKKSSPGSLQTSPIERPARPKIEVVRSTDDRISFTGQGGPMLAVRIDRKRLATLTGLFSGTSLGMIAHYLVLNALAARDPLPGDGTDTSIATFVDHQEQLLSRALITTRLGKTPSPDSIGAALPPFPPALAAHTELRAISTPPPGEAMLFRAFAPSEVAFVQRMLSNDTAEPFMRAAQLFVGLCANDAVVADERERRRVGVALTAYAALATAEISRIFLRGRISGAPALFKSTDSGFDDAAKTVLAALADSIT